MPGPLACLRLGGNPISAGGFLKFSETIAGLDEDLKVMIALYLLAPTKNGLAISDLNSEVFDGCTYGQLLNGLMHRREIKLVTQLHEKFKKNGKFKYQDS